MLKERTSANVGWTTANLALWAKPENAEYLESERYAREDLYLEGADRETIVKASQVACSIIDSPVMDLMTGQPLDPEVTSGPRGLSAIA